MHYETDFKRIRNKVENYAEDYTYLNTLEYLFYYIGGVHIFVHIKNNDLLFLPFVNIKYRNDWKTDLSKNDAIKIMKKSIPNRDEKTNIPRNINAYLTMKGFRLLLPETLKP